jgi:hypothetical protein
MGTKGRHLFGDEPDGKKALNDSRRKVMGGSFAVYNVFDIDPPQEQKVLPTGVTFFCLLATSLEQKESTV